MAEMSGGLQLKCNEKINELSRSILSWQWALILRLSQNELLINISAHPIRRRRTRRVRWATGRQGTCPPGASANKSTYYFWTSYNQRKSYNLQAEGTASSNSFWLLIYRNWKTVAYQRLGDVSSVVDVLGELVVGDLHALFGGHVWECGWQERKRFWKGKTLLLMQIGHLYAMERKTEVTSEQNRITARRLRRNFLWL